MPRQEHAKWELAPAQLRFSCDPASLGIQTTADAAPNEKIIGQDRAIKAIEIGMRLKSQGYNIYISGLTGTGKSTTVKKLLEKIDARGTTPGDICYVHHFADPDSPTVLAFPPGQGKQFSSDVEKMILSLQKHIPQQYESDSYKNHRKQVIEDFKRKAQSAIQAFETTVQKAGFTLVQIQAGLGTRPEILPVISGEVVPWQKLDELVSQGKVSAQDVKSMQEKHDAFMEKLQEIASLHQEMEKETQENLHTLERNAAKPTVYAQIRFLKKQYGSEKASKYLDEVAENILHNLSRFQKNGDEEKKPSLLPEQKPSNDDPFLEYKVNVIVDNSATRGVPIVIETAPMFSNLFGMIERSWIPPGIWKTDFMHIKAGSLLRANGGFIVFNLLEALAEPGVWKTLKRALKNNQLSIQSLDQIPGFVTSALKPEPIDINVKVLVYGDEMTYRLMYEYDDEFKKIFKIRADFDTEMNNTRKAVKEYVGFAAKIIRDEKLLPLDARALASVIEYGVFLTGKKKKLSTRFSDIADIIRESHYWASQAGRALITGNDVDKAVEEKKYRIKKIEEKIQEMIDEDILIIDISGSRTGQVNGLSVYDLGDYMFGKPSKITAEVAMGKSGIINIEREAGLGGSTYNKGVLILTGYLRRQYAQDKPLAISASLCFEQSYSGVDGDSASSTEIYALLSALSGVPLRQDIAVTGSVNQKGEIQPIGGVNEKIEGFFDVCRAKKLTGKQGVIIPIQNVGDLMLKKEVVETVSAGKFHIWAIRTIDEGIEILTGRSAGKRQNDGRFPKGSIHFLADQKLSEFAERMKAFGPGV